MSSSNKQSEEISNAEAELYDRQIRLWGLEAQNRLRNAAVLLVGLSGLGAEVAKNLMLCGLKSMTIMDDQEISDDDKASQFLLNAECESKNRAEGSKQRTQKLNPMVDLFVSRDSIDSKSEEFFAQFNLVILIDQTFDVTNKVNKICRRLGIRFQAGGVFGWTGFAFFDSNEHLFLLPKPKEYAALELDDSDDENAAGPSAVKKAKNGVETLTVEDEEEQKIQQKVSFPSFENAFNIDFGAKRLTRRSKTSIPSTFYAIRALLNVANSTGMVAANAAFEAYKNLLTEAKVDESRPLLTAEDFKFFTAPQLSPVCAIVGSIIGQEAIKAISQNDVPLKNVFIYSALETSGIVCELPPR